MVRLTGIRIKGYRSIKDTVTIKLPERVPLVIVGENNAGKSNIVRALDLILGEFWPGNKKPDDHEFWNRDPQNGSIEIQVSWEGLTKTDYYGRNVRIDSFLWKYEPNSENELCSFRGYTSTTHVSINNEMRDKCMCVVVGADRRLSYQLSYTSKWTLLFKLMQKFHQKLIADQNRVSRLKDEFAQIKRIFNEVSEFGSFQQGLIEQFGAMFSGMTYGLQVDFSAYDPSNFFHSLRVAPHGDNQPRNFKELGSGQEQLLALVFAHAYAKAFYGGIVLVIEEPEAHLHPLAQEWLARKIHEMAEDGLQVIITTHSPAFVNLTGLDGIVLVRKIDGATFTTQITSADLADLCVRTGAHRSRTNARTILPFYASSATQEIMSGLFAKKVVLVEGQTEQLALPAYLEKVGLDVTKEGINIIPVSGKGSLAKWWRFFKAYRIPVFITFDNDMSEDSGGEKRRDALSTIGLETDDIDSLIGTEDWIVGDSYCVFGQDFERTMRHSFADYSELETRAKSEIGDTKPLVARFVAEKIEANNEDVGWQKLSELKDKIIAMGLDRSIPVSEEETSQLPDDELPF